MPKRFSRLTAAFHTIDQDMAVSAAAARRKDLEFCNDRRKLSDAELVNKYGLEYLEAQGLYMWDSLMTQQQKEEHIKSHYSLRNGYYKDQA